MLSLRGLQEGAAGFRGMADDVELEEGEACPDDDGACDFVDPDVALSYIVSTSLPSRARGMHPRRRVVPASLRRLLIQCAERLDRSNFARRSLRALRDFAVPL